MFRKYENLGYFKSYYWKQKRTIRVIVIIMLLASSLGMLLPYLVSKRILGIADTSFEIVFQYSAIIMTIVLFHHIFVYLWERIGSGLANRIAVDIRNDIIHRFLNTKYSEIKNKTSGYYLERINDDILEVSNFIYYILGMIADCSTNSVFLALIFFLSYQCGIIFIIGILAMCLIEFVKIKANLKYVETLKELNERFNSKINENFRGIKDIKGLGIKEQIRIDTNDISIKIAEIQIKKDTHYAQFSRCKTFVQHFTESILIVYSVKFLIPAQTISVVILLMILNYGGFIYDLVGYIAQIKDWFVRGEYKASRLMQILNDANIEKFGHCDKIYSHGIRVENLSYAYDNDFILKNITLVIPEKTVTIFIGVSGSGKTTFFNALSGLLQCERNTVFIGNTDINELSENCFRDNVCIINQEPFLLNDTILNNVKIVKPTATLDEIYDACRKAHIFDEVDDFENGFDTIVSENGNNLSGGQRQRISIARALLKNSNILLFDEPTSSLDKVNQELFFETIEELKTKKTILLIAHKLNDYSMFDNVYEMKQGQMYKLT